MIMPPVMPRFAFESLSETHSRWSAVVGRVGSPMAHLREHVPGDQQAISVLSESLEPRRHLPVLAIPLAFVLGERVDEINAERGHAHVSDRGEVQLWILSGDAHPSGSRSASRIVRSS